MGACCSRLKLHKRDKTDPLGSEPDPPISRDESTTKPPDSPHRSDNCRVQVFPSISEPTSPNFCHHNNLKKEPKVQNHSLNAPPPPPLLGNIHNENRLLCLQDNTLRLQDTPSTSTKLQDTPSKNASPPLLGNIHRETQLVRLQHTPSPSTNQLLPLQDIPSRSTFQTPSPFSYLYKRPTSRYWQNERTPSPFTYLFYREGRRPLLLNRTGSDHHDQLTPRPSTYLYDIIKSAPEQGIRKVSLQLLNLKDAVENLCANTCTKYLAFLRSSGDVVEVERELTDLRKHMSAQGILVQELLNGACHDLDEWTQAICESRESEKLLQNEEEEAHKVEQALEDIDHEVPFFHEPFSRMSMEDQLDSVAKETIIEGPLAHELLLKSCGSCLQKNIKLLQFWSSDPETFLAKLSDLVFSAISWAIKNSDWRFGDDIVNKYRVLQWAQTEIESFVRLVKEHAPPSETVFGLRAASMSTEASLSHCSSLEPQGLELSRLLLVLLTPYIEEVLELNFRRAQRIIFAFGESWSFFPQFACQPSIFATSSDSSIFLELCLQSAMGFISMVTDIVEPLTPSVILLFGANGLTEISQLFDNYVDALIGAMERLKIKTGQLALLGTVFAVAEEQLPMVVSSIWSTLNRRDEVDPRPLGSTMPSNTLKLNDWRRQLQNSYIKLADHFCQQYMQSLIYDGDGKALLNAQIYLACGCNGDQDLSLWYSDPLPSLPFQALFRKLRQVADGVLRGKEKIQKILFKRLTEMVLMWLSKEQKFWHLLEDEVAPPPPLGLLQLILDMHFTLESAYVAGFRSTHIHQIASDIIARAIGTFSARCRDHQSELPDEKWFIEMARTAINKISQGEGIF